MKLRAVLGMTLLIGSMNASAFHVVNEILPDGRLLICQDYNQIKKGDVVEIYERFRNDTDRNVKMVKMREITLPKVGEKIKLTHSDFHQIGTSSVNEYHTEGSGSATIIDARELLGANRYYRPAPNEAKAYDFSKTYVIDEKTIAEISQKCLVAKADGEKITELKKVSW